MNTIKSSRSLLDLIDDKEKEAKKLKLQTRLLRNYVQKIGK
jgi:hypothetical protein